MLRHSPIVKPGLSLLNLQTADMRFKQWMAALHYQPEGRLSPWLWPMLPLAGFYGLGVRLRLWAYQQGWLRSFHPPVPVISVGNLTTGGTGKTPLVIALARTLLAAGHRVVILSRGYGAVEPLPYTRATDPRYGDEAFLIQQAVPEAVVIVGRDRVQTLQRAIREHQPDYVLLDDGFQYLRLERALNILLIDGEVLCGNTQLLPVGPLREPLAEIRRADVIFLTKTVSPESLQQVQDWLKRFPRKRSERSSKTKPVTFEPSQSPSPDTLPMAVAGTPVLSVPFEPVALRFENGAERLLRECVGRLAVLVSGIARPTRFELDLTQAGLHIVQHCRFPDHHPYMPEDVETIVSTWRQAFKEKPSSPPLLITTDKDWPKLKPLLPPDLRDAACTLQTLPALDGAWFYEEFLAGLASNVSCEGGAHVPFGHGA